VGLNKFRLAEISMSMPESLARQQIDQLLAASG